MVYPKEKFRSRLVATFVEFASGIDTSWFAVDEDDRETSAQITGQVVLARGGRDDDETIDATLHERVD